MHLSGESRSYDYDKPGDAGMRVSSLGRDVPIATARRSNATEQSGIIA